MTGFLPFASAIIALIALVAIGSYEHGWIHDARASRGTWEQGGERARGRDAGLQNRRHTNVALESTGTRDGSIDQRFQHELPSLTESVEDDIIQCPCREILARPDLWQKAAVARWMVHSLDWGVVTTLSTRSTGSNIVRPFGNVYSFVDGTCDNSTGVPYFYGTMMDQTFQDMMVNPVATLTLSEAGLASVCGAIGREVCQTYAPASVSTFRNDGHFHSLHNNVGGPKNHHVGDPESPVCARVTLTGELQVVAEGSTEYLLAQEALFQRHPQMQTWPVDHDWQIAKLTNLVDVWFIDFFGGANIISPEEYYSAALDQ